MHTPSSCRCASAVGLAEHSNSLRIGQRPSLRSSFVPPPSAFAQYGQLSVDAFDAEASGGLDARDPLTPGSPW